MNLLKTLDTKLNAFLFKYDAPLIEKALQDRGLTVGVNTFNRALYQYLGDNLPVYMQDNVENYITQGYAFNADVYGIVNYITNVLASVPWKLYRKKGQDEWDVVEEHPLMDLLRRPNQFQGQFDFFKELAAYELLTGNTYPYAPFLENGLNKGKTTELHVLKAHLVQIVSGGWKQPVKGYKYVMDNESTTKDIEAGNVYHFKNFNPTGYGGEDLYGMSPIKAAIRQVALSSEGTNANAAAYRNQGVKGLVYGEGDAWTATQAKTTEQTWQQKNGVQNTGKLVFTPGKLGYIPLGLSPVDLNILQGMLHNFRQLCNVFDGFPSVLLNDNENSTYNNLDTAHKAVYTNCVLPRLYRYRDGFNNWLTPRYGADLWLDIDTSGIDVLQENKKELAETLDKAWWIKVNDKQKMMGAPEDPNLDFYMMPANYVAVRDINDVLPGDTSTEEIVKQLKERGL